MAWKEIDLVELAESLGTNITEVKEKQKLISMITKIRKAKKLSQAALARKLGISQARVAQIESGIGTAQVTFDVLFNILIALGYDYRVVAKKVA
jgi:transcriptional regulator with XRE-family HTH domain